MASNDNDVYHIYGTPYTFDNATRTVHFEEIGAEEYEKLT
jgi:hypothetical protein